MGSVKEVENYDDSDDLGLSQLHAFGGVNFLILGNGEST